MCLWVLYPQIQPTVGKLFSLHYTILYKGLEHLRILAPQEFLEPIPHQYRGMTRVYTCISRSTFTPIYASLASYEKVDYKQRLESVIGKMVQSYADIMCF